ncbi:transposase, partial [Mesorhizobium marinum]|uniref:transposase n=1 Tax=Mesorhizobium marinum TaxID=3228790 RepID=UPI0034674402
ATSPSPRPRRRGFPARSSRSAAGCREGLISATTATHKTTNHAAGEYARREGDVVVHYTIEGVFSVFKRGMVGVYQHCGEAHLHRYLAEFDFRYNRRSALKVSDAERADDLLRNARDKRLTYRRIGEADHA